MNTASGSTAVLSPWGKKISPNNLIQEQEEPIISLGEIMSEELAHSLQSNEEREIEKQSIVDDGGVGGKKFEIDMMENNLDCDNDYLLAQYLQMEFDREHDKMLSREEEKYNGNDKGTFYLFFEKSIFKDRSCAILIDFVNRS